MGRPRGGFQPGHKPNPELVKQESERVQVLKERRRANARKARSLQREKPRSAEKAESNRQIADYLARVGAPQRF